VTGSKAITTNAQSISCRIAVIAGCAIGLASAGIPKAYISPGFIALAHADFVHGARIGVTGINTSTADAHKIRITIESRITRIIRIAVTGFAIGRVSVDASSCGVAPYIYCALRDPRVLEQ
jgi:hypothetical protein